MAGWSSLVKVRPNSVVLRGARKLFDQTSLTTLRNGLTQQVRMGGGGHRTMAITPSRWQWHKFKDMLHFYTMLGAIPLAAVIFYANVFVGPAELAEIPQDYVPKHWEYYRHPIQRFFARYVYTSHQQEYEKYMHLIFEEDEKRKLRSLEHKIKEKMSERGDYQGYYYRPAIAKYHRIMAEDYAKLKALEGDQ